MTFTLLSLMVALAIGIVVIYVARSRIGYISVPVFAASILLAWFTPQALIALNNNFLPEQGVVSILAMALGSLAFVLWGWVSGGKFYRTAYPSPVNSRETPLQRTMNEIPDNRLYILVAGITGFAALVQLAILRQPPEVLLSRQPSGFITILKMLSTVNPIAMFLATVLVIHKRNAITLGLAAIALATFVVPILVNFKRNEIVELGAVFVFALWAMRRFSVPRLSLPLFAILGLIILFGAGAIRKATGFSVSDSGGIQAELVTVENLTTIDLDDTILKQLSSQSAEIENGIYLIDYAISHEIPTFGQRFWNQFVIRWVPGQFVGTEFKQSLQFNVANTRGAMAENGLIWQVGTTSTGFSEVFLDFSFASVLLFFAMAYYSRRCYDRGLSGQLSSAAVYPSLAILCVVSLTHGGYTFFLTLPLILGVQFAIQFVTQQREPRQIRTKTGSGNHEISGYYYSYR